MATGSRSAPRNRGVVSGPWSGRTVDGCLASLAPVSEGAHAVSAKVPFGLVVEGWGPGPVSYGYTGGMEFNPVNHDCTIDADCPEAEFCAGGTCVPPIQ